MSILKNIQHSPINDMKDLFKNHDEFMKDSKKPEARWIFRGQKYNKVDVNGQDKKNMKYLTTSLEKAIDDFDLVMDKAPQIEKGLLRKFKRHSSLYLKNIPDLYSYMEWFALMQHYGSPTRLQDWTYSFFAAVYMAINDMQENAEVWAINANYIAKSAMNIIGKKDILGNILFDKTIDEIVKNDASAHIPGMFEKIFMLEPKEFVLPMNPYNLNERLIIQQGIFLCPGDVSQNFDDNLSAHFTEAEINKDNIRLFKITDDKNIKKDILRHLHRMNMNNATLFPGLNGFSESLRTLLAYFPDEAGILTGDSDFVKNYLWDMNKCNYKDDADR